MGTLREEISEWFDEGVRLGATHMIVAMDGFSHEDYPVYVMPGESARQKAADISDPKPRPQHDTIKNRVMEVYSLKQDKDTQLAEGRAFHFD